jgi:hypothetical protein
MYEYKMVQVPPTIQLQTRDHVGNEAALYLQSIANEQAAQGWEFFRVDEVGVRNNPGCLASLFGQKAITTTYYVVTFRKTRSN